MGVEHFFPPTQIKKFKIFRLDRNKALPPPPPPTTTTKNNGYPKSSPQTPLQEVRETNVIYHTVGEKQYETSQLPFTDQDIIEHVFQISTSLGGGTGGPRVITGHGGIILKNQRCLDGYSDTTKFGGAPSKTVGKWGLSL